MIAGHRRHSVLSENTQSPESSFKRSPILQSRPILLTSTTNPRNPNKHKNYVLTPEGIDKMSGKEKAYTLPLLDGDDLDLNLNVNSKGSHHRKNRVIHRSLSRWTFW